MKKMVLGIILMVMMVVGCAGGAKPVTNSNGMDLDTAIKEAAAQMEIKIPLKTMVALVSVASPSTAFSTQVLTRLESAIVNSGKLVVVDRANLDKVREEQGFQLSGEVDDESAKSIGKLLGAGAIVTGSLADLGDVYSLTLKAINIETATVAVSYLADLAKSSRVETLLASGGGAGTVVRTTQTGGSVVTTTPASTPTPPTITYKIGDTGPAGGIIFYDKGNNSGGWRYLEAAPLEIEFQALWSINGNQINTNLDKTQDSVGYGKRNTQFIIETFKQTAGEWDTAAQKTDELLFNEFDDWFLPSKDELNLMYGNLKRRNLGDFGDEWYWSSTEWNVNIWGDAAYCQNFKDGQIDGRNKKRNRCYVRPIRQF
jgi:hypothetical protein